MKKGRVMNFLSNLNAFKSRRRSSQASLSSTTSSAMAYTPTGPSPGDSLEDTRVATRNPTLTRLPLTPTEERRNPNSRRHSSIRRSSSYDGHQDNSYLDPSSLHAAETRQQQRRSSTLPYIYANDTPQRSTVALSDAPPRLPAISSIPLWRYIPSMFSSNSSMGSRSTTLTPASEATAIPPIPPHPPIHRKGDVLCLKYDTLDDRGMRRLEGRSDHRPVIGSYAMYI
jgi:hypothetical protein